MNKVDYLCTPISKWNIKNNSYVKNLRNFRKKGDGWESRFLFEQEE